MSQRLLISKKENITEKDDYFDAIYTEDGDVYDLLRWVSYHPLFGYVGPLKIEIRDRDFYDKFMEDFKLLGEMCPKISKMSDCWAVWEKDDLIHQNKELSDQFDKIIKNLIEDHT